MTRTVLDSRRSRTSCSILALATVMAVGATPAEAQSFLGTGTYTTNPNATGITTAPNTTTINLNGGQTIIDWVPTDNAVGGGGINFQNAGTTALFTGSSDFAVLNRINQADISRAILMNGTVNSRVGAAQRGSVYFYSPGGFIFGGSSVFSVGSLVVTTSPIQLTGSNFINGAENTVVFGQALNPSASISSGGTIHANTAALGVLPPGNSYVAMVAPRVSHSGTITVNGSAALVAAEAATINFSPDGLFDIQVTVGSDDDLGITVNGDIGGPAPASATDRQGVYLVAVPKNDAMTMIISNGADLGFTLANDASIDAAGVVVLSAGHDITNGQIAGESAAPGSGLANFWFTGAHATNNLFGEATGYADLYSTDAQASQLITTFDSDVTVHAAEHVLMNAWGTDTQLTVGGDLNLSTDAFANGPGDSAIGGETSLSVNNGGILTVAGNATLSANGWGGSSESFGVGGGNGTGGQVQVQAAGGDLSIGGNLDASASGHGGSGFGANGGTGTGGLVDISASGGGTLTIGNGDNIGTLTAYAQGTGGGGGSFGDTSGNGFGGTIQIRALADGMVSITSGIDANATGFGGFTGFQGLSGNGEGGDIFLQAQGGNSTLNAGGNVELVANGEAGDDGECFGCGGGLGDGLGGSVLVGANDGSTLNLPGTLTMTANGYGAVGVDVDGGTGTGGQVQLYAADNSTVSLEGDLFANADGYGGERMSGGYGGDLPPIAGDGIGGFAELFTYGTGDAQLLLAGNAYVHADGVGGNNDVDGVTPIAGSGTGGIAWLNAQTGSIDISGNVVVAATGEGGSATFGTGGNGAGRNAEIDALGGDVTIGGTAVVDVSGRGGDGLVGGTGIGGGEQFEDGSGVDGAHIIARNGSVSIGGVTTLTAAGEGGHGLDGDISADGGAGGDGTGGWTAVVASNSDLGPSSITLSTLNISASATGGGGGQGGSGNQGGNGGEGGDAQGGSVQVFANAGNGNLSITTVNASAIATGGQGGDGGNGDGLAGGSGGDGGNAEGGGISVGTASGAAQATGSNLGTATYGSIIANASATGGRGGDGNFGATSGNGGNGGDAIGGGATLLVRGSTVNVDTVTLTANATGGDAGFGYFPEVGTPGITGVGGDATVGGDGNGIAVLATGRFLIPTQRGTLNAGSITGTAIASSGIGIPDGDSTYLGGSEVTFLNADGNIGSLDFEIGFGGQNTSASGVDTISVINGAVDVDGTFSFATPGNLSFLIDNGSLTAGTIDLSAGNFVTDPVNAPPLNRGTAFADTVLISSDGDFIADANFEVTNTFVVDVPGSIRVGSVQDDNGIDFTAGGSMSIDGIDAGSFLNLFAFDSIDTDDILAGSFVDIESEAGSIGVGNIDAGSSVSLVAGTFIAGEDISTSGSIFAQTFGGDIGLENLTSTFGTITLDAAGDINLSGDLLADGDIELTADGNILMNNATTHQSLDFTSGGYLDGLDMTAGDSIDVLAGGSVTLGNLSAGLVNPSFNTDADYAVAIHAGGAIVTGNIAAAQNIGLATPGTMTTGDIDAGGIFMALGHGDMSFGDAIAAEVFLADYAMLGGGGITATCVGTCGTLGPDGLVIAPPTGPSYSYVTTDGGVAGAGQIAGEGGTNGSLYTTSVFTADAGDDLSFWFNYVTSDGSGFADYAWAALLTASLDPVATLFTARTRPEGTIIPGQDLPGVEATLNPAAVPIIDGGPEWSPLGTDSGACYAAGCGYTGWVSSTYDISEAGSYILRFGVTNALDTGFQSGMAFSGITVGGSPVSSAPTRTGGSITIGNVDTGKFTAAAGTSLTTGIIDSTGSISLDAGGAITTANLFAGNFVLAIGGSITTGNIEADSVDMTSTGGNIATGTIFAFGDVELDAFGDILTGDITAGTIDLFAGDDITTGDLTTQFQLVLTDGGITTQLFPGASITLEAGGDIATGNIDSIDGVYANAGGDISTGWIEANDFVELIAIDDISTGYIDAGQYILAESGGDQSLGNLSAGWDIELEAGGNIAFGNADAGTEFDFEAGGNVTGGDIVAGIEIGGEGAGGSVTLGNLTAGFGEGETEDVASIGFSAGGSITVGNVNSARSAGFATLGNLTTGSIQTGDDFLALASGNITTGSITTGEGDQVYMAHSSMCVTGGGCSEAETDFDPEILFALDPVATGGSITINGLVSTGLFDAAAGTSLTTQAMNVAGDIHARAGGTATLNGVWNSGDDVELASNDIDITASGGINAADVVGLFSTNATQALIGDGLTGTGYALSNAEFGRISGYDVAIAARGDASAAIDMLVGDLTVTGPLVGSTIEGAEGILAFAVGDIDGETVSGVIRVNGDVAATGFGSGNAIEFYATRFELDAATGSVSILSSGSTLGGELGLYADRIHVAEGAILNQLAANPTYTGYQQDLNEAATVQRPEGVLRADTLWIESDNLQDILIQNTGTTDTPAGFLVRQAFVNDDEEVAGPAGSINLVVNGQVVTEGGTLTGIEARDALITEETDITPFTSNSTINGCPLTGACVIAPPPPPPTADVVDNQIDLITGDPFGESEFDDNQEGEEGSSNPISPPQPLFDTRPLIPSSDVNDPVSGTGNPALLGTSECADDDGDQTQCGTEKEGGQ